MQYFHNTTEVSTCTSTCSWPQMHISYFLNRKKSTSNDQIKLQIKVYLSFDNRYMFLVLMDYV